MVKIKKFLYGTAVLVISVSALYGFTLIEKGTSTVPRQWSQRGRGIWWSDEY